MVFLSADTYSGAHKGLIGSGFAGYGPFPGTACQSRGGCLCSGSLCCLRGKEVAGVPDVLLAGQGPWKFLGLLWQVLLWRTGSLPSL